MPGDVRAAEKAALVLLLVCALFPASPATAVGIVDPDYRDLWTLRPFGGASLVELGLVAVAAMLVLRPDSSLGVRSPLDRHVVAFAAVVAGLQVVARLRNAPGLGYELLDLERVVLLLAGYLVVTRLRLERAGVERAVALIGGALLVSFAYLVVRHGLLGSTEFGTVTGREALLITEDSLLVLTPLIVAFGLAFDGLLGWRAVALTAALVAAVAAVELLSLRRGALILITVALLARAVLARRTWFARVAAVAAVALAVGLAAGPARPLAGDLPYLLDSARLRTDDASTSQRKSELENFERNLHGPADVVLGRGLGAVWNAEVPGPIEAASFGRGETAYVRVGWHVYGLDWLYKLGLAGVLAGLALLVHAAGVVRRRSRAMPDPRARSLVLSLAVAVPVLSLLLFTNARVALFAGVAIGLVSQLVDGSATQRKITSRASPGSSIALEPAGGSKPG